MTSKTKIDYKDEILGTYLHQPVLHTVLRSAFYQSLQIVRCFDASPGNSLTAAHFSLLFQELGLKSSLLNLHKYLHTYIEPYIGRHPRDQADLSGKVLAVATYLNISDRNQIDSEIPVGRLIDYLEYAAEQSWLQDTFLAYYCSHLEESAVACQNARSYLKENCELYLNKRNIPAISQTLIALDADLSAQQRENGYDQLCAVLRDDINSIKHPSWALAALAKRQNATSVSECRYRLAMYLDEQLTELTTIVSHNIGISDLFAFAWTVSDFVDDSSDSDSYSVEGPHHAYTASVVDANRIQFDVNLNNLFTQQSLPPLADIALALAAIASAREHRIVGVREEEKGLLQTALNHAQVINNAEGIVISKKGNAIFGVIIFVNVLIVGIAICLYFAGVDLQLKWDFSQADERNWDVVGFAILLLDYLFHLARAIITGQPVIEEMGRWPILRYFGPLIRNAFQKAKPSENEHDHAT